METLTHFFQYLQHLLHLQSLPPDFALVLPEVQLLLFGLGILLTDFLLEDQYKYWNAVMALLGVGFSGFSLWRLRGSAAAELRRFQRFDSGGPVFHFLWNAVPGGDGVGGAAFGALPHDRKGESRGILRAAFVRHGRNDVHDLRLRSRSWSSWAWRRWPSASTCWWDSCDAIDDRTKAPSNICCLGAFSSGILAYGFSILYGLSAVADLHEHVRAWHLPLRAHESGDYRGGRGAPRARTICW